MTPARSPRRTPLALLAAIALAALACGGGSTPPPPVDVSPVPAADPGSALPDGWERGPFAEIYVRGYQDSDGDGVGDLRGLASRLDHLADLGVRGIWLMPVTASQDHDHGYAVADYRGVEPGYGTLEDLDALVAAAHARGIGVILDYVMNHSAATNPLFLNSADDKSNPYRGWYVWRSSQPSGWSVYGGNPWRQSGTGWYYAPFATNMPDFDLANPAVAAYHADSQRFWLNRGVDGFRFDAVGMLYENGPGAWNDQPENYVRMAEVRALLDGYERRFMVCEGPDDPAGFTAACGSAFAFGLQSDVMGAARGDAAAVARVAAYFEDPARLAASTLLSNHDAFAGQRPWDQLGGDEARYRLAAATYLLLPGIPFVYYGEEIGMGGAASLSGDWRLRTPMSWTGDARTAGFTTGKPFRALSSNAATHNVEAEQGRAGSLLEFYREVIALRRAVPALDRGGYEGARASGATLSFRRTLGTSHALVLLNYDVVPLTLPVTGLPPGAALAPRLPATAPAVTADAAGAASFDLPALSVRVYTWDG
ncbi:alpha amylase catalytic region [Anaeromyxobacter dehalogenans 2CP-1]|uniref:Alpha amylase catalytic region n=1 Tax=Anaeromyxobacter dehalogenans (strain ATCC BAA-258 / DSM 21875 / 2CP-1) TaxID=455488 RepID=B8JBY4_ANAD2|nr:alpha-amylase family glycosyl hydrolase [Anaeromyxobacter dehalogenans]ACL63906.1 alpha amylase catalytic region [Anaeromyxobacter dehalogenans 2CP-1]